MSLDFDDYLNDTHESLVFENSINIDMGQWMESSDAGIHSASMGGIWQGAVMGFGGVKVSERGVLSMDPRLPKGWASLSFRFIWRGCPLMVTLSEDSVIIENKGKLPVRPILWGEESLIAADGRHEANKEDQSCDIKR